MTAVDHSPCCRSRRFERGTTLVELIVVIAVLGILTTAAVPVVKFSVKRAKEVELRHHLRTMRNAIDEYKRYSDAGLFTLELGSEGYPAELEMLIEPVDVVGQVDRQVRFLRRIPVDPMTGEEEWGLRSVRDEPDSTSWGGENVFDVYSLSEGTALDGTSYETW